MTGQTLLMDLLNIWFTNVVVFALWFWNLADRGPAMQSLNKENAKSDLLFAQAGNSIAGYADWTPGFVDYFFVSFPNATAFSSDRHNAIEPALQAAVRC